MSKHLKELLFFGLRGIMGAILLMAISVGIYLPLSERGIITIKEGAGFSSIWVNWEITVIYLFALTVAVWLTYKFTFRKKKEVKSG